MLQCSMHRVQKAKMEGGHQPSDRSCSRCSHAVSLRHGAHDCALGNLMMHSCRVGAWQYVVSDPANGHTKTCCRSEQALVKCAHHTALQHALASAMKAGSTLDSQRSAKIQTKNPKLQSRWFLYVKPTSWLGIVKLIVLHL